MTIYSKLLEKMILPSLLARENQSSALSHFTFLQKSQFWSTDRLLTFQFESIKKLLKESYNNTVYYRIILDERGLTPESFKDFDDLKKLPVLTRDITFDRQEQFFSNKFNKSSLQEFTSGGTTGQHAILFRDMESFNIKLAMAWRHETWMGKFPCDKMALIWPAAMDINENEPLKTRIKNRYLLRTMIYNAGGLDAASLNFINKDLLAFNPKYLKVFPSALFGYTEFCIENNLKHPKYKAILSTGEPLSENQKKLFEQTYNCPVFDMYGSREVGNTSSECSVHHGMHIAMETSYVEFIKDGQEVKKGERGEMLITDLTNYAFPLIRYAINDYGAPMDGACTCGRGLVRMDKALGRLSDNIFKPDGSKILGHVLGIALTFEGPPIGQTQVIQKTYNDFVVKITNKPKPTQEILNFIDSEMKKLIGDSINISIEIVDEIPKEKSGKTRFIKCEIDG